MTTSIKNFNVMCNWKGQDWIAKTFPIKTITEIMYRRAKHIDSYTMAFRLMATYFDDITLPDCAVKNIEVWYDFKFLLKQYTMVIQQYNLKEDCFNMLTSKEKSIYTSSFGCHGYGMTQIRVLKNHTKWFDTINNKDADVLDQHNIINFFIWASTTSIGIKAYNSLMTKVAA